MRISQISLFISLILLIGWPLLILAEEKKLEVVILGLDPEQKKNVEIFLSLYQQREHADLSEARIRRLHKRAPEEIRAALQPFGYYKPQIVATLTQPAKNRWLAKYDIQIGPGIPLKTVDISLFGDAKNDPVFQQWLQNAPIKPGQRLDHSQYGSAKNTLLQIAAERGFLDARFTAHAIRVDLEKYEASITLHLDSGTRYHFGQTQFNQDVLEPELIERFQLFKAGDPYHIGKLIDLQQALGNSDYFQSVEVIAPKEQAENGLVPVIVSLTPRKKHRYTLGIGYGTDTGVRGKLGWEVPRVNRKGHRFDSTLRASQISTSISLRYRIPVLNPRTDQLIFSGGWTDESTRISRSQISTLSGSLLHTRAKWRETVSLTYQEERFRIADDTSLSTLLMPGISWNRVWATDRINPHKGVRLGIDFRGASEFIVSDTSFTQVQLDAKWIIPLQTRTRVLLRGQAGGTLADKFVQLPASVRFFTGGAETVRGYAYRSLSPKNDQGRELGGRHLLVSSAEIEHGITENWGLAVFFDSGNAFDTLATLQHGAGAGIRWHSPVGPIRLDFARGLSLPGKPWQIHLTIGPDL